ncbi:MAG: rRNA pseudouridine synthase [Bacteroidia bacterium]|nr:rRNA pseudouridine synthase [Bacteroidia bacterium]
MFDDNNKPKRPRIKKEEVAVTRPYKRPYQGDSDSHPAKRNEGSNAYNRNDSGFGEKSSTFKKEGYSRDKKSDTGDFKSYKGKDDRSFDKKVSGEGYKGFKTDRKPATTTTYKKSEGGRGRGTEVETRPYKKADSKSTPSDRPYKRPETGSFRAPKGDFKPSDRKPDRGVKRSAGPDKPYERKGPASRPGSKSFSNSNRDERPLKNPFSKGETKATGRKIEAGDVWDNPKKLRKDDPRGRHLGKKTRKKSETAEAVNDDGLLRLNRFIANSGICSRREADTLIEQGLITVNGTVVTEVGTKVKREDTVKYNGSRIKPEPFVYLLLNKPKDYLTTTDDDKGRKTVMDLVADASSERLFPVGRLDRNTTGVILLTNDGEITQALTHPRFQIKKIYHVVLDKKVSGDDLNKLIDGVYLEDGMVKADAVAYVEKEDKRHVGIEIHSGKNRVVRRMFESLGYEVEKLDRVAFGDFTKKNVERGQYRFLNEKEIGYLQKLKKKL